MLILIIIYKKLWIMCMIINLILYELWVNFRIKTNETNEIFKFAFFSTKVKTGQCVYFSQYSKKKKIDQSLNEETWKEIQPEIRQASIFFNIQKRRK